MCAVYYMCVYFNKKVSLTKLSRLQSKNLSVNTFSDHRKINYLNIYQVKNQTKHFFLSRNQALRVNINICIFAVKWVLKYSHRNKNVWVVLFPTKPRTMFYSYYWGNISKSESHQWSNTRGCQLLTAWETAVKC